MNEWNEWGINHKFSNAEIRVIELVNTEIERGHVKYIVNKMHMIDQAKEMGFVSAIGVALREKHYYNKGYAAVQKLNMIRFINYWFGEKFDSMTLIKKCSKD